MATNPVALITGASSGIGLELARQCAADGDDLIVAARQHPFPSIEVPINNAGVGDSGLRA